MLSPVATYLVRRLAQAALVLVAVSALAFVLIYLTGDPARAMAPLDAGPADIESIRRVLGLDQPIYVQYGRFVERVLHGDLGESFKYREGALGLVVQRLPNTALLAVSAITI